MAQGGERGAPGGMSTFVLPGVAGSTWKDAEVPGAGQNKKLQGCFEILVFLSESHFLLGAGRKHRPSGRWTGSLQGCGKPEKAPAQLMWDSWPSLSNLLISGRSRNSGVFLFLFLMTTSHC